MKSKGLALLLTAALCLSCGSLPATAEEDAAAEPPDDYYTNSIMEDIGDPFVMRWNGRYYLYPSSGTQQISCYTSTDLVHWEGPVICADDPALTNAYAPEVVYYNGYFYMYTSPNGQGHYALQAESPTGPFTLITGNEGRNIDGDVFIDDDGQWYFLTSGGTCITRYAMTSPSSFGAEQPVTAASMFNSWTEGPMVVKHDGLYYMTYTGNHVLHKGYRVGYAVGDSMDNLSKATDTLLVSSEGPIYGPGHSSSVKGPDLDSYYIAYHTLVSAENGSPYRNMSIDRLVFNGADMEALGPTATPQQMPAQPDIYSYFDSQEALEGWSGGQIQDGALALGSRDMVLSDQTYSGSFTAEFCLSDITGRRGAAGAVFAYADADNYATALLDVATQSLVVTLVEDGQETQAAQLPLPKSFGEDVRLDCLQAIQIEYDGETYEFFFNDRSLGTLDIPDTGAAYKVGLYADGTDARCSYLGLTGAVHGSSADTYAKPVPGSIQARNCLEALPDGAEVAVGAADGVTDYYALAAGAGQDYSYQVLVAEDGKYDFSAYYRSDADAEVTLSVDGQAVYTGTLPASADYSTAVLRGISLPQGEHTLSITYTGGAPEVKDYTFAAHDAVEPTSVTYDTDQDGATYSDGPWTVQDGQLLMPDASYGKRLYGQAGWSDYTVEADITPVSGANCGLLVRASNPDSGIYVDQPQTGPAQTGTDYLQGYFVGLGLLGKQDYSWTTLIQYDFPVTLGTTYHMKVECRGANIKVYIDGTLYVDYTDPAPFLNGRAGMRSHNTTVQYDNLTVTPINDELKTPLAQLIAQTADADTAGAEADRLAAFQQALADAEDMLDSATATEADMDGAYAALLDAYVNLKDADYTAVDAAIARAEALDPNAYEDFSAVTAALEAVERGKNWTEQEAVDAMAQAIIDAIDALVKIETPVIKGDMNGDGLVDITDVMSACKILARSNAGSQPTDEERARGDMNEDGYVAIDDVMAICKILAAQS